MCRNKCYCTHRKIECVYWYAHFSKNCTQCRYVHRLASVQNHFWKRKSITIERMNEKKRTNEIPILYRIVFTGVYQHINSNYGKKVLFISMRHDVPASQHILGFHTLTPFVNIRPEHPICYRCNCENQCSRNRNDSRFEHQKARWETEQFKCFVPYALINSKFILLEQRFDHADMNK